ncbi:MAG: hypothetical protein P8R54_19465 [Myxococcota bacterium]|nr:hypothetical protein [Myxococcota bacterium]
MQACDTECPDADCRQAERRALWSTEPAAATVRWNARRLQAALAEMEQGRPELSAMGLRRSTASH